MKFLRSTRGFLILSICNFFYDQKKITKLNPNIAIVFLDYNNVEWASDFCSKFQHAAITFSRSIYESLSGRIDVYLLPSGFVGSLYLQKILIKSLSPRLILVGGVHSGFYSWLSKKFETILVYDDIYDFGSNELMAIHSAYEALGRRGFLSKIYLFIMAKLSFCVYANNKIISEIYPLSFRGVLLALKEYLLLSRKRPREYFDPNGAVCIIAPGNNIYNSIIKNGTPQRKIHLIQSIHQAYYDVTINGLKAEHLGLASNHLVLATNANEMRSRPEEVVRHYYDIVEEILQKAFVAGIPILLKLHPQTSRAIIDRFSRFNPVIERLTAIQQINIAQKARLIISGISTFSYPFLKLGVPIGYVDGYLGGSDYEGVLGLLRIKNADQAIRLYRELDNPKERDLIIRNQRQAMSSVTKHGLSPETSAYSLQGVITKILNDDSE